MFPYSMFGDFWYKCITQSLRPQGCLSDTDNLRGHLFTFILVLVRIETLVQIQFWTINSLCTPPPDIDDVLKVLLVVGFKFIFYKIFSSSGFTLRYGRFETFIRSKLSDIVNFISASIANQELSRCSRGSPGVVGLNV